jgi:hypothetical protein
MKRSVIAAWKTLAPNQYAATLAEMNDQQLVSTADGARCAAAYWLTPARHRGNAGLLPYVSWRESDVPVEIRGQVRQLSTACIRVKAKIVADGKILLPSVPSAVIDAEFTRYLQNVDAWNSGGSEFDVRRDRRWSAATPAAKQFASVAELLTQLPASEAAAERLFSIFVCLFNERRLWSDVDLVEAEMIIRMWMVYHPELVALPLELSAGD